ncbi:low-specificity L-threonine aldolase [Modicisalibacter xianhensis]|nr:low-specificity L-threonine aldolase [Halomonas xianhensis]
MIDLRSDTVTRPSQRMREAIARAEVGDDVWGDDPSVAAFEKNVAERAGFAAGLLFPSGTQSNLTALMAHCERGDEFIAGQQSHLYKYEGGGAAVLASLQPQPIDTAHDGTLPLEKVVAAIKRDDIHFARTRLIALENTFQGKVLPQDYTQQVIALAEEYGLLTHLDGARLFNAAVATGQPLDALCRGFDSVSLCFSKGLGAPVGSVLVGSESFIARARRWRKTLGGGMRQAGILAAGCQFALDHHVDELADDHRHAQLLAEGLASLPGVEDIECHTNMVFARFPEAHRQALAEHLAEQGILMEPLARTRFVTHRDISQADIQRVLNGMQTYFRDKVGVTPQQARQNA